MSTCRSVGAARALLALTALACTPLAWADARISPIAPLPAYSRECGACHIAYPPALLGAASWQRVMADLGRHFGADASLDAATTREVTDWLVAYAASGRRAAGAPPPERITRSAWFVHEHDELSASVWQRPSVRSAANCAACHPQAEQGDFNEHRVRVPR